MLGVVGRVKRTLRFDVRGAGLPRFARNDGEWGLDCFASLAMTGLKSLDCHASLAMTGGGVDCHASLAMTGGGVGTGLPRFARNDGRGVSGLLYFVRNDGE